MEIRDERKSQNLSTKDTAETVGISRRVQNYVEIANNKFTSVYRLKLMSLALNIPLHVIIKRSENRYNNIEKNDIYYDHIDELTNITNSDVEQFVKNVGHVLSEVRKSNGISASKLSKQLKITRQAYNKYEKMTSINISLYKVIELCGVLEVSIHEVIERAEKRLYEDLRNGRDTTGDVHKES
ncbi:helix-turn-helix domain-containing protein [Staphylococcus equorum]|uniref:Helix-turn-helix domain-containing protein n=1 Tax=Staphylococcus equorum TaxID=246432 RepID=A0A9X4L5A6_9STAP|nr:helix-turn-helix transcriptional regulator [Staphylococcus equorum]MDG0820731.1 helix-turn-helix domain-containing protein [Staphylococcus equorum]MDG0841356.1 helix-turn-helix domain-containing protein [Staphylococcus equorum]MDG0847056.1 helix-turn-helix domain-containing protein [Staphylococcus equorum]